MFTLLIVDDDDGFHMMLDMLLEDANWTIVHTNDPTEARERFAVGDIDVVLTDFTMPGYDGAKLVEYLRQEDPDVVAVVMTGRDCKDTVLRAMRAGAYDYISKPYGSEEIIAMLQRAFKERLRRQSNRNNGSGDSSADVEAQAEMLNEREEFLQRSEELLMERMAELSEKEADLEQMEERLKGSER